MLAMSLAFKIFDLEKAFNSRTEYKVIYGYYEFVTFLVFNAIISKIFLQYLT